MTTPVETLDIEALRAETPGCRERIHLNNAGSALMPAPVIRAIEEHIDLEARIGGYEAADARREQIAAVYDAVGALINAPPANVAVVEHATQGFVQALS